MIKPIEGKRGGCYTKNPCVTLLLENLTNFVKYKEMLQNKFTNFSLKQAMYKSIY